MITKNWTTTALLFLGVAIGGQFAEAAPFSDTLVLIERIVDRDGLRVNDVASFRLEEGQNQDQTFPIPGRRVDFLEPGGRLSDTFFFKSFTVRVRSDDNPGGLPSRQGQGIPQIDREDFETDHYSFSSDSINPPDEDDGRIQIAVAPHGDLQTIKTLGGTEADTFTINAGGYDVLEPPNEPDFNPDKPVSDYLDFSEVRGGFCSDDETGGLPDCSNGQLINVAIVEGSDGASVDYSLVFISDVAVPEPGTLGLLIAGLISLGAVRFRKVA